MGTRPWPADMGADRGLRHQGIYARLRLRFGGLQGMRDSRGTECGREIVLE